MAIQTFTPHEEFVETGRAQTPTGRINRYRLLVVAGTTFDVVQGAGGWICDRVWAGWDVHVLVANWCDPLALRILGATTERLEPEFTSGITAVPRSGALAVSAELLATDRRVRADVLSVLDDGFAEVVVWGDSRPAELGAQLEPVPHQMSAAAKAFKSQALAVAAPKRVCVGATETLYRIGAEALRPLYAI